MDVTKQILFLLLLIPFFSFGQKSKYPKDTIYIKFEKKIGNKKWFGNYGYGKNKKQGTLFNLKGTDKQSMSFFLGKKQNLDTLCIKHLKEYEFSGNTLEVMLHIFLNIVKRTCF